MKDLQNFYKNNIVSYLMKELNYSSIMQVPKIEKIVLNIGVGKTTENKKLLENAFSDLTKISGQKPIITKAKKSIAGFKIRKGFPIGCKVTLRKKRMWNFLEKLIFIAIPRIHDFRGFSKKSFDNQGNYNIGIREQIIFPEIKYDKIDCIRGLNIAIKITGNSYNEGLALLNAFHFPFRK